MDLSLSKLRERVKDREAWRAAVHGVEKSRARLSDWTATNLNSPKDRKEEVAFTEQLLFTGGFPGDLVVKYPPVNAGDFQETWVWFLGREDPLEKEMATHSSILAWKIPWTEEPGGLQSMGSQNLTQLSTQACTVYKGSTLFKGGLNADISYPWTLPVRASLVAQW